MTHLDSQPIGSCVLLLNGKDQVLLGKRKGGYKPGIYGVPGGRVDGTEPLESAAVRELKEEAGVTAKSLDYLGVVREVQEKGNTFVHFIYICRDFDGEVSNVEPHKCEGWEWFGLDALPDTILPGHAAGINMLAKSDSSIRDI